MSIKLKQIILTTLLSTTFIFTFSNTGSTGPLENLERERAMVIKNIIDPEKILEIFQFDCFFNTFVVF